METKQNKTSEKNSGNSDEKQCSCLKEHTHTHNSAHRLQRKESDEFINIYINLYLTKRT